MTALQDLALTTLGGEPATLRDYEGQVLLVVNVASKCGLTPQYTGLQALYDKYAPEGFAVLGFPANDFAGQEPGTNEEIAGFCQANYGVTFPMFAKIQVTGPDKHPLYAALTAAKPETPGAEAMRGKLEGYGMTPTRPPEVLWNFEKFLIGRDGEVAERFAPDTAPEDERLVRAIERELFASE